MKRRRVKRKRNPPFRLFTVNSKQIACHTSTKEAFRYLCIVSTHAHKFVIGLEPLFFKFAFPLLIFTIKLLLEV